MNARTFRPKRPIAYSVSSTSEEVADIFDLLTSAAHWFERALDSVRRSQNAEGPTCSDHRVAEARSELARLDPPVLLAGIEVWLKRDHDPEAAVERTSQPLGAGSHT